MYQGTTSVVPSSLSGCVKIIKNKPGL